MLTFLITLGIIIVFGFIIHAIYKTPKIDYDDIDNGIVQFNLKKSGLEISDEDKYKSFVKYKDFKVTIRSKVYVYSALVNKKSWIAGKNVGYSADYIFKDETGNVIDDKSLHLELFNEIVLNSRDDFDMNVFLGFDKNSTDAARIFMNLYDDTHL